MALMLFALSRNLFAWRQSLLEGAGNKAASSASSTTPSRICTASGSASSAKGTLGTGTGTSGQRPGSIGMEVRYAQARSGSRG